MPSCLASRNLKVDKDRGAKGSLETIKKNVRAVERAISERHAIPYGIYSKLANHYLKV